MAELAMPLLPITSQRTVDLCASLPLRPNDVFICSYPKSGTTWTQHIVLSLLVRSASKKLSNDKDRQNLAYQHVSEYAPFYEVDQHWDAESNELTTSVKANQDRLGRRVFNTHLRWNMLPKKMASTPSGKNKAKFIYLMRSPMDVCLSFYCHLSNQKEGGYEGDFQDFFNDWIEGKIAFGSYIDHVCSFATAFAETSDTCDVLLLSYEEMLSDLQAVVSKVARFIEADVTDDDIKELLPTFTFAHMKTDLNKFQPRSVTWKNNFQFLRRGVSGDSLTVATDAQRKALAEWFEKERFKDKLKSMLYDSNYALDKIMYVLGNDDPKYRTRLSLNSC